MCKHYQKYDGETNEELLIRVGDDKDEQGMTWDEIADIMNNLTGNYYDESTWRKQYHTYKKILGEDQSEYFDIEQKKRELYKARIKNADIVREYRSTLRDEARIETIIEALREDVSKVDVNEFVSDESHAIVTEPSEKKEGILCISDWHIGDEFTNFYNSYDLKTAIDRLKNLKEKVVYYCNVGGITHLHIVNLGDMINGIIHVTTRISNELDIVEQVKLAARLIYGLLVGINQSGVKITYRSVLDNHSRIVANLKDHIEKESFAKLIDWWLQLKIEQYNMTTKNNPILFVKDNIDDNIGYFEAGKKKIAFTHGHLGKPATIVQDLTLSTGIMFDIFLVGHWHEDKVKSFQGKKVFYNGSLKGVDGYALSLRKFSAPSQTLLIFDNDDIINIPINL